LGELLTSAKGFRNRSPDKISTVSRDVGIPEGAGHLPPTALECKGEQGTAIAHDLPFSGLCNHGGYGLLYRAASV